METADDPVSKASGAKTLLRLREIPTSQRYFWREELSSHIRQQVRDRTHDGANDRPLLPNEIDALALNEIAVLRGAGFFMFLPSRNSWNKQMFDPKNRGPAADSLRASVPSLVFMRYTWTESAQTDYFQSPHRSRFMACDFLLNPPPEATPLYCIQVASDCRYPLYSTEQASFIILRAAPLYFGKTADLGAIIGRPPRKRTGVDSAQRLGQPRGIWDGGSKDERLGRFEQPTLEHLYDAVIAACHPATTPSSMTCGQLLWLLPRPSQPELGIDLGFDSSEPQSRLDVRVHRLPSRAKASDQADEQ
ncbi:hypothetical protein yc1106_02752 [Curvularia clavata]|uniref:Uncharacterized protein n=1 Tax=Curvularia clavata TaxID=95742 RepID=A0A9Q8Z714_CURCL|nr:hypothetical protein yc1106_02752 [Curvularia clavata]